MFADLWIISVLIIYAASGFLLLRALPVGIGILKGWNLSSSTPEQLQLERKNYLVSVLVQYALFFQIILLIFFLQLVNVHLPQLIKGAMCATGTLSMNAYGYPALYIKIAAVFLYIAFLFINYLDQSETGFPLTPQKYWLLFVVVAVFIYDFYLTIFYFAQIEPDVIATCCSINIDFNFSSAADNQTTMFPVPVLINIFYGLGLLILPVVFLAKGRLVLVTPVLSLLFIYFDLPVLKYHFVKFIYALPSHNCLFDIFWAEYYYVGYWIFGTLALHLVTLLMLAIVQVVQTRTDLIRVSLYTKLKWLSAGGLLAHILILSAYWINWII